MRAPVGGGIRLGFTDLARRRCEFCVAFLRQELLFLARILHGFCRFCADFARSLQILRGILLTQNVKKWTTMWGPAPVMTSASWAPLGRDYSYAKLNYSYAKLNLFLRDFDEEQFWRFSDEIALILHEFCFDLLRAANFASLPQTSEVCFDFASQDP